MMTSYGNVVLFEVRSGVGMVTLNRPQAMNSYDSTVVAEFGAVVDELETLAEQGELSAVLLLGAGDKVFCCGADIRHLATLDRDAKNTFCEVSNKDLCRFQDLADSEGCPIPTIAAAHGMFVGGGLEFFLAARYGVAWADCPEKLALVGFPEVNLGLTAGDGGPYRCSQRIGPSKTSFMLATGELISFEQALNWGLIHKLFPADSVEGFHKTVFDWVQQRFCLPHVATLAVRRSVQLVADTWDLPRAEALDVSAGIQDELFQSDDAQGILASWAVGNKGQDVERVGH